MERSDTGGAAVRDELHEWLSRHASDLERIRVDGGTFEDRLAWTRTLAEHGWTCVGWPTEHGGRGLSLGDQVAFYEEYARSGAPESVNHLGEKLLGPTLIEFGTPAQQERFLPTIRSADELWCQGYSEPGAGSDLANVQTKARLDGSTWVLDGQKVWTSNAHESDWIFVLARTEPGSQRHHGLSFLLVPMDQDGIEVRPIRQLTGESEFNEVFFDAARTDTDLVVGEPGDGWRVAMALLGFERGVSTLADQVRFARELDHLVARAQDNGRYDDPLIRDRLARARVDLEVMWLNAVRGTHPSVAKLVWAHWHRDLGELAMDVAGPEGLLTGPDYALDEQQRLFLFSRADTIYGGSDEVQRNILAEQVLGLPREARP